MWKGVLNYLSIFQHFDDMTRGILDTKDVAYYLSFAFVGIFLTHSVIQSRRWR
jgi:ABC-2 type transport system permease protein